SDRSGEQAAAPTASHDYLARPLGELVDRLAARTGAPGGGSVAAVVTAMAAALVAMAARFSAGHLEGSEEVAARADVLAAAAARLAQADAEAYEAVLAIRGRAGDHRLALSSAAEVPFQVAQLAAEAAALASEVAVAGNPHLRVDALSAALLCEAAARSAAALVASNLAGATRDDRPARAGLLAESAGDSVSRAAAAATGGR
ncbi:MAG: cyclodeaminase/cyclohydrolase family protein, partial [Acidimicrobiales bacterium]